jgi:hypothetical protein
MPETLNKCKACDTINLAHTVLRRLIAELSCMYWKMMIYLKPGNYGALYLGHCE